MAEARESEPDYVSTVPFHWREQVTGPGPTPRVGEGCFPYGQATAKSGGKRCGYRILSFFYYYQVFYFNSSVVNIVLE